MVSAVTVVHLQVPAILIGTGCYLSLPVQVSHRNREYCYRVWATFFPRARQLFLVQGIFWFLSEVPRTFTREIRVFCNCRIFNTGSGLDSRKMRGFCNYRIFNTGSGLDISTDWCNPASHGSGISRLWNSYCRSWSSGTASRNNYLGSTAIAEPRTFGHAVSAP